MPASRLDAPVRSRLLPFVFVAALLLACSGSAVPLSAQAELSTGCQFLNSVGLGQFPEGPATTPSALAFNAGDTFTLTVTGLPPSTIFSFELPTGTVVASSPSPISYTVPADISGTLTIAASAYPEVPTGSTQFTCSNLAVPVMPPFALIGLFGALLIVGAVVIARRRRAQPTPLGA
jgi:hypothetical protein